MTDTIQKVEFDAFIDQHDWPVLEPFTEDKQYGGFIELGLNTLYAQPTPGNWKPVHVKVTIELVMEKKQNAKKPV